MSNLIQPALDWLTATGAPNWVVLLALLTAPHLWAKQIKDRLTPLLDGYLPGSD